MHRSHLKYALFILSAILLIGFLFMMIVKIRYPIALVDLAAIRWETVPNTVSLFPAQREGREGILFIRLKDGKEQFIAGNWKAHSAPSGSVYTFGEFPQGYSSSTGQQLYAIKLSNVIQKIDLGGVTGTIVSVDENPRGTYLLMSMLKDGEQSFCVIEQGDASSVTGCQRLSIDHLVQGVWHPTKDHELLLRDAQGVEYVFDPWEDEKTRIRRIDPDSNPKEYLDIQNIFQGDSHGSAFQDRPLQSFLNLLMVSSGATRSYYHVPLFSRVMWLRDGHHLLVKRGQALFVMDLSARSTALVLDESWVTRTTVDPLPF